MTSSSAKWWTCGPSAIFQNGVCMHLNSILLSWAATCGDDETFLSYDTHKMKMLMIIPIFFCEDFYKNSYAKYTAQNTTDHCNIKPKFFVTFRENMNVKI